MLCVVVGGKLIEAPQNLEVDNFRRPEGYFGLCRRCSVAGGERVPPAPLGYNWAPPGPS